MSTIMDTPFEAHFLQGTHGRLFGLYFPAIGEARGQLLCIPPFAEESNRCRAMMGLGARTLAQHGFGVLILDLYGCGDSEGDFEQADWSIWQDDIQTGIAWLSTKPGPITLWGIRLGALLAMQAAEQSSQPISQLLFWQPVSNAKQMFTQYLRLRVANSLEAFGKQETTNELRERLANGESLEIGGYYISPQIAADLDAATMPAEPALNGQRIVWLEAADKDKAEVSIGSRKIINGWRDKQVDVQPLTFHGPPFWQLHERFMAPNLIEKTCQAMGAP